MTGCALGVIHIAQRGPALPVDELMPICRHRLPALSELTSLTSVREARIEASCEVTDVVEVVSFQGGVVGSSVYCALAVRTALLSKLIAVVFAEVKAFDPLSKLSPMRFEDKLTIVRSVPSPNNSIIEGSAALAVRADHFPQG